METQEKRKRRLLLILPLLVIPFLALAFYAMGGGRKDPNLSIAANKGINTSLPEAKFKKEEPKDKLGFYAEAGKATENENAVKDVAGKLGFNRVEEDPQTEQINKKLEVLNREITRPVKPGSYSGYKPPQHQNSSMKNDVDRLEALMRSMQRSGGQDPEMEQLGGIMDKILDLQHPERLKEKYDAKLLTNLDSQFKAIPAYIEGNQKIMQGSVIKLRLKDTIRLNGEIIPKNQLLYGTAVISNQRVLLDIKTIRLGTSIVPVNLSVYSLDGMKGINAPEAVLSEAVSGGTDDVLRNLQVLTSDQSVATQIAGAGLDAAKSVLSKRVRKVKVKLKAGELVLLRNNNTKARPPAKRS
jgi:hypothetical protein